MAKKLITSSVPNRNGTEILNDVMNLFVDLLVASGATIRAIEQAFANATVDVVEAKNGTVFKELGAVQRDCMEVMCKWRREPTLADREGEPLPLARSGQAQSFDSLCRRAACISEPDAILRALMEFGAVSIDRDGKIRSETPTFLLGRAAGRLLATDGLLKQLEGYLGVVHRNVRSVAGQAQPRFERACTVSVASELEPIFDRLVRSRGQEFVDSIDEWLERNSSKESAAGHYVELGAGAYFIDLGNGRSRSDIG